MQTSEDKSRERENIESGMELLAPAGGFEQLQAAIAFGADAIYLAADRFGMRARAANFALEDIARAVDVAHAASVKIHVACNVLVLQNQLADLPRHFEAIDAAGADALIIGDMGAFALARKHAPHCELHVSTQASVANAEAARMWHELGASRIVCAREMSLEDIAAMRADTPPDLTLEAFVHGAQCMAVSGRCLISSYIAGRSGNMGNCTQPCRWNYTLEEEKRPDQHFPIEESDHGTLIMNAKDLCMIEHLDALRDAGIRSLKIEGRNKKAFYVASVVGAYRRALDGAPVEEVMPELLDVSHRPYSTGFFFGPAEQAVDYDGYEQETLHVADVVGCKAPDNGNATFRIALKCRNRFEEGDELEVLSPHVPVRSLRIENLSWIPENEDGDQLPEQPVAIANRSCNIYLTDSPFAIEPGSFIRRREHRRTART